MFCNIFLVLVLILIFVLNIECDNSNPSSKNPRVIIDKLTEDVIKSEKHLLAQLSSKQLQYERGQLLDEVYRIYLPFYTTPIGDHQSIRSVGFQRVKDLIDNVILVDSNRRNFRASLATQQYDVTNEIAHNALDQMINSADGIYQSVSKRIFWQNIINQAQTEQCKPRTALQQNPNQMIFDVYKEVAASMLKSYLNLQLSSIITKYNQIENDTKPVDLDGNRLKFQQRYDEIQSLCIESLAQADRKKWTCDKGIYPNLYHQITRFLQGYVDNEINLNSDSSCKKTCSDYSNTQNYGCNADTLCAETHVDHASTKCNGTILNCEYIDGELTACPSVQKINTRRYDFIKYSNGKTFGNADSCLQPLKARSWRSWFVECSTCFCLCDEQSNLSDRFFSLHDVTSNIELNRIVTGVSIIKRNRLIEFVIAESELLPQGNVNAANTEGIDVANSRMRSHPEFHVDDAGIRNNVDYFTLTSENRALNLDTVIAPPGKVLTGIRFHVTNDKRLTLQIRVTDFNFDTGKLENLDKSIWLSSTKKDRTPIQLYRPDVPTQAVTRFDPIWTTNQYIEFGPTDREKDASQLTVPFIDGTFVEAKPTILSGAGFYLKEQPGYGGFIAPNLVVYDFSTLIKPLKVD